MKIALWSANPMLGDVEANVETVVRAVKAREADVVAFPEMFLTGYNIGDEASRLAFKASDERLEPILSACAKSKVALAVGAPRKGRPGVIHNSSLLVDETGEARWQDKRVLPTFTTFQEGLFFTPGKDSKVWETRHAAFGVGICYDLYFPELQRLQVLRGADVLLNLSASPSTSRRFFELLLQARAVENAVFSCYSNNVGAQDGLVFWGGSCAIGPRGQGLAALEPYEEGRAIAELDLRDLQAAREFRPTVRDAKEADAAALAAVTGLRPAAPRAGARATRPKRAGKGAGKGKGGK
ncbi:MAG TPA: carbon-nitrogen hydrolase family protein [Candidatus Thermoplasmatota archaeon]|nr:carbon-nitrogen hydrolase family protein [Candidatus Thermoplasmatota archaeon]